MDAQFEKAIRMKLRFETPQGVVTVEDLWDLPLTAAANRANLDDVARSLAVQIKEQGEVQSFVVKRESKDERLELGLDIVKRVIEVRLAEREATERRRENRAKKQEILAIIAEKQSMGLREKSSDELAAMVAELQD